MTNGVIVYRGPSLLTGDPIVCIVTGLTHQSKNSKTGPMLQTYILREDISPSEAIQTGKDDAICGDCKHRSGSNIGRSCYVIWWLGPLNVWKAMGRYPVVVGPTSVWLTVGQHVRVGTYGDPAAVPIDVWRNLLRLSDGWTGYTHHWKTCDPALREWLMASVDTPAEKAEAHAMGWRTFRARNAHDALDENEVVCPASEEAGHSTTCEACQLCRGSARQAKSVAIIVHGQRVKWFAREATA